MRARIRTVKPDLLLDEDLWDLEQENPELPILRAFEGLWMFADREGRFEWRPRVLGPSILPFWQGDFSRVLDALATRGFIAKYTCGTRVYGVVRTFTKHQVINNKEPASQLPPPPDDLFDPPEPGADAGPSSNETASHSDDFTREPRVSYALATREPRESDAALTDSSLARAREGKGKGKGKGNRKGNGVCEGVPAAPPPQPAPLVLDPPKPPAKAPDPKTPSASAATWEAYSAAYFARYQAEPIANAKVRGQLAQFVRRVPASEAPAIAAAYLRSSNARYVAAGHSVGCLLQDAEKLRTEWLTGRQQTAHVARQADKRAGRGEEYERAFAELRAMDEAEQSARVTGGR